ncbi:MAG: discoidin domain-containing protein, partial [Bacteroidota bacterium]|nr:discoidin domain-containing protein [Bacteroidota bacterium]
MPFAQKEKILIKIIACFIFIIAVFPSLHAQTALPDGTVKILFTPGNAANSFIPSHTLGAAFDGHEKGDIDHMLTPENIMEMRSVELTPLSYRLRTELEGEVWHWNPNGTWSESGKQQGYWVSDSTSLKPINISHGYFLPRRGNTIDQANNTGYSRVDDGNVKTFWKSNPYLDEYFTKESNAIHPQWVVVDLGKLMDVNAIRINWGNPYATSFKAEYSLDNGSAYFEPYQPGMWHPFSKKNINDQRGENKTVILSDKPVKARLVRITMMQSAYISTKISGDIRDRLGFAIKEIELGFLDKNGKFTDWIKHAPNHYNQSRISVSSTDPWHRATDKDVNIEQAGIDRFFNCGITNKQPTLMSVGLLYDTPENMESMLKYLLAKHYPVEEMEMGEEPEGQLISPVDYASLYFQWANKLKQIAPNIRMGGPGFAGLAFAEQDSSTFSEAKWTSIFIDYLKKHNSLNCFNFFTTEWYPFSGECKPSAPQLAAAAERLDIALRNIRAVLPPDIPIYFTEYGYSAFSLQAEVEIEGALMYADILGKFLSVGGSKAFMYGYEPAYLEKDNCGWGNNILFGLDDDGKIIYKTAAYYGMQMLTKYWAQPSNSTLGFFPANCNIVNEK